MRDQEMCCRAVVLAVNSRDQAHILKSALYCILNPLANVLSRGCPWRQLQLFSACTS
jgi:transposase